jgi:hypothetical protein
MKRKEIEQFMRIYHSFVKQEKILQELKKHYRKRDYKND